jgi:hypothetical protein
VRSRILVVGFALIVALALVTGSVLLVEYAAAAASLLIVVTLLARKAPQWVRFSHAVARPSMGRFTRPGSGMTTYIADDVFAPALHGRPTDASRETRSPHETRREQRQSSNVDQVLDNSFPASDPPSWTGAISHVAATSNRHHINERLVRRIRAEFLEMPGLCLTIEQAQRLWCLEPRTCEALLKSLIDSRFLRRTDRGLFALCTPHG